MSPVRRVLLTAVLGPLDGCGPDAPSPSSGTSVASETVPVRDTVSSAFERGQRFLGPFDEPGLSGERYSSGRLGDEHGLYFTLGRSPNDTLAAVWLTRQIGGEPHVVAALAFDPRRERGRLQLLRDTGDGCYLPDRRGENGVAIGLAVFEAEQDPNSCDYQEADEVTEAWLLDVASEPPFQALDPADVVCYRGACP